MNSSSRLLDLEQIRSGLPSVHGRAGIGGFELGLGLGG